MAKDKGNDLVSTLRERGLSCARLKSLEKRELKESQEFRKIGFDNIARAQEASARKIKSLRNEVCKLR